MELAQMDYLSTKGRARSKPSTVADSEREWREGRKKLD